MMQFSCGEQVLVNHVYVESTRLQEKPRELECLGSLEVESVSSSSISSTSSISAYADVSSEGSCNYCDGTTHTNALADWDNWFVEENDYHMLFIICGEKRLHFADCFAIAKVF